LLSPLPLHLSFQEPPLTLRAIARSPYLTRPHLYIAHVLAPMLVLLANIAT